MPADGSGEKEYAVGHRGNVDEETDLALLSLAVAKETTILVTVNGEAPRSMKMLDKIDAPRGERVARVTIDLVRATPLPAPGARTPEQSFWLEPEIPCLVDAACLATVLGVTPMRMASSD